MFEKENVENRHLAFIAYMAYGEETNYKNFQGNPMPKFDDLPESIKMAWCNAVKAIRRSVVNMNMSAEAE